MLHHSPTQSCEMLPPPPEKQNKNCPSNTTPMRTRDTGTVVVRVENIALLGALHAFYPTYPGSVRNWSGPGIENVAFALRNWVLAISDEFSTPENANPLFIFEWLACVAVFVCVRGSWISITSSIAPKLFAQYFRPGVWLSCFFSVFHWKQFCKPLFHLTSDVRRMCNLNRLACRCSCQWQSNDRNGN